MSKKKKGSVGYIYKITNIINNMVYIGQTTKTVQIRFRQHKNDARNNKGNMYIHRAMRKYGEENFIVEELLEVNVDNSEELVSELNKQEIHYISLFNTLHPNGYNLTKGGDTSTFECNYISSRSKLTYQYNGTTGELINTFESIAMAGRATNCRVSGITQAIKNNIKSIGCYWSHDKYDVYPIPEDRRVAVDKYSEQGELLGEYLSIADAVSSVGKTDQYSSAISNCCKGKTRFALGFVWRLHGEPFNKYDISFLNKKNKKAKLSVEVDQYSLEGEYLNTYESYASASRHVTKKDNSPSIAKVCNGEAPSSLGYVWRYKGEPFDKYDSSRGKPYVPKAKFTILQFDINTHKLINVFKTIREAEETLKISAYNIVDYRTKNDYRIYDTNIFIKYYDQQ